MGLRDAWIRLVSQLVPHDERAEWVREWRAELTVSGQGMAHAWGAVSDAWYLRTEGWTMDGMARDIRTAVRGLIRRPFFTALAGITLAVGIGANTAIFSVVDGVLLNPLPFPHSERLVSYNHEAPGLGINVPLIPHSEASYLYYSEHARSIEALTVFTETNVNLVGDGDPQRISAMYATHEYFTVLQRQPLVGRAFVEGDDVHGAEPVVILSEGLWQRRYGRDPSVLGQLLDIDGVMRRVVGVMPSGVSILSEEAWLAMQIDRTAAEAGSFSYIGAARLAEGATVEMADTEMHELLLRFAESSPDQFPEGALEEAGLDSDVKLLKEVFVEDIRPVLWVLLGTVGIVLLVACANVANLFLVRAEGRMREQAVRTAMGASRADMVRQYLTESVTLAAGAGLLGLALGSSGVRGLLTMVPAELPQALDIGIDGSVLLFTAVISLVSGLLFGVVPTLGYGRRDLSLELKDGNRSSTGGRSQLRARSVLVVAQVALALVLLVGSGLMLRSFHALRSVDPGFDTEGLLSFQVGLPSAEYGSPERTIDFHRQLEERLAAIPGAELVGAINGLPLTGAKSASPMEPADRPFGEDELAPIVEHRRVTPGYFATMSIPIVEGRSLEWSDQATEFLGVVVSQALARALWPGESPIGRGIRRAGGEQAWEIVGVAGDVRFDGIEDDPLPMLYEPLVRGTAEAPDLATSMDVVVKLSGDPLAAVQPAREAVRSIDPRIPIILPRTVESIVSDSMQATSFTVLLLGIAAGIALLLGTVGIYGVIAYVVSRRTAEIGVRMALGAPASLVLRRVVGQGAVLIGIGLGVGLIGSWALSRALASLLYGVTATDPLTFAGTAVILATVSLAATYLPARRAARIDPVEALRTE